MTKLEMNEFMFGFISKLSPDDLMHNTEVIEILVNNESAPARMLAAISKNITNAQLAKLASDDNEMVRYAATEYKAAINGIINEKANTIQTDTHTIPGTDVGIPVAPKNLDKSKNHTDQNGWVWEWNGMHGEWEPSLSDMGL
jgi:hypothetical protein